MDKVIDIASPKPTRRRKRPSSQDGERATVAYDLLLRGKSHSEVARLIGAEDSSIVWRIVSERFAMDANYLSQQERKTMLASEVLRLNAVQDAHWEAAMMGDIASARVVLEVIKTRAKITGLETVDPVVQKNLVLVMGEKEQDYIEALRKVSDD